MVIGIGLYLIVMAVAYTAALGFLLIAPPPQLPAELVVGLRCATVGGLGGCFYCLRAMYINISVRKQWGSEWHAWYFIRPLTSLMSGGVSFLFMKAGLLVLESGTKPEASKIGFYAVAFIAGLNVDRFTNKIEEVAEAVWGIKKSRTAQDTESKS